MVASARGACPAGVGYKDITVPFDVENGTYEVTLVGAGSPCSAAPLATARRSPGRVGKGAGRLSRGGRLGRHREALVLNEEVPLGEASAIRFANAIPGSGPSDFGRRPPQ